MKKAFVKRLIANQFVIVDMKTKMEYIAYPKGKLRYVWLDEKNEFNKSETKKTKLEQKIVTLSPKVGDYVYYEEKDQILIDQILPRKNDLTRPDVANVDQVLLTFSAIKPDFSFNLLDRFLIIMQKENVSPTIVVTKIDLVEDEFLSSIKEKLSYYEKMGLKIYYVNSKARIGFDCLIDIFKDKITCLAGQTGVGKSTLLNALLPELNLKTQEISKALGRGKHTTRHTELYDFNNGYIVDTPGFSKIDFQIHDYRELKEYYPDFVNLSSECKFGSSCNHENEPGCKVKEMVRKNEILSERYLNYLSFIQLIKDQKTKY